MDSKFITKAAQGNMAEVKLGQLAQDKASNQAVKDFGKQMVDDHTKALDNLKKVASDDGVSMPSSINAKDQALYDRLSKLSGSDFDRQYMAAMVKDHETDVAEFRKESNSAKTANVKEYASTTLPTLEEHLTHAKDVNSKVGTSAKK
jgi:putative membrane protein